MNPGTSGPKPARTAGLPVAAIIASVRPWKLLLSEIIFQRPGVLACPRSRASLTAASLASAPLWQKNAWPGNAWRFEPLGELDLRLGVERVADVPEPLGLLRRGADEVRVAVPEDRPAEAGEEVEVALAVGVADERALAALHDDAASGRSSRSAPSAPVPATPASATSTASFPFAAADYHKCRAD